MAKKKPFDPLPLEFVIPARWRLMGKNKMPGFKTEMATVDLGKGRTWRVTMDIMGRAMFFETDLKRQDGGIVSAVYELPLLQDNADALSHMLQGLNLERK